jgi:hypothetical protein
MSDSVYRPPRSAAKGGVRTVDPNSDAPRMPSRWPRPDTAASSSQTPVGVRPTGAHAERRPRARNRSGPAPSWDFLNPEDAGDSKAAVATPTDPTDSRIRRLRADDLESYVATTSVLRRLSVAVACCATLAVCGVMIAALAVFVASLLAGHALDSWLVTAPGGPTSAVRGGGTTPDVFGAGGVVVGVAVSAAARSVVGRVRASLARSPDAGWSSR